MKKKFFIMSLAFMAMQMACTNETDIQRCDSMKSSEGQLTHIRSFEEVIRIARDAAQMGASMGTRAKASRSIDFNNIQIINGFSTRSSDEDSDTLLYIVNYTEDQGFAVIAANPNVEGLLAVTEKGQYFHEEGSEATGFDIFMNLAKKYAAEEEGEPDRGSQPRPPVTIDTTYETVLPFIDVKWGQENWPGQYCPNNIAGCVPLALAQIFTYYSYPTSINLSYSGHDISTQQLNWADMRNHVLYYLDNGIESTQYCSASDSAHNAIGRLCRQLGQMMNSSYEQDGTGTTLPNVAPCLNTLGYSHSNWSTYTAGCTQTSLFNNRPILMSGDRAGGFGHVWIIDGYTLMTIIRTEYVDLIDLSGYVPVVTTTTKFYNHINWGWDGRNNGYFLDGVFNINNPYQFDDNPNSPYSNRNYIYNLEIMTVYRQNYP